MERWFEEMSKSEARRANERWQAEIDSDLEGGFA